MEYINSLYDKISGSFKENGDNRFAVLDSEFTVISSNDCEFFNDPYMFLGLVGEAASTGGVVRIKKGDDVYAVRIRKRSEDKQFIAYIEDNKEAYDVFADSELCRPLARYANLVQIVMSKLLSLKENYPMRHACGDISESAFLTELDNHYCKLLTMNSNMLQFVEDSEQLKSEVMVNLCEAMDMLMRECQNFLSEAKRFIYYSRCEELLYLPINSRKFTVAVINLLQNALLYSPEDSRIMVRLDNEDGYAVIKIINDIRHEETADSEEYTQRCGFGVPVARRFFEVNGGSFYLTEADGAMTAVASLVIRKTERARSFTSEYNEYISERYKPVHLYLNEVLAKGSK